MKALAMVQAAIDAIEAKRLGRRTNWTKIAKNNRKQDSVELMKEKLTKRATKLIDRQACSLTGTYPSIQIFE